MIRHNAFEWKKYNIFGTIIWLFLLQLRTFGLGGIGLIILGIIKGITIVIIIGCVLVFVGVILHFVLLPKYLAVLDRKKERKEENIRKHKLSNEIQGLKEIYPNFNYRVEIQNKQFNELVNNHGCSLKDAYESLHNL